jgi:uncharacterized protein (TIGR02246 family)
MLVGSCADSEAQTNSLGSTDREAIVAVTQAWMTAHANRDWESLSTHYTDNAILMPPFAPIIRGRDAIKEWFAENENHTSVIVEIVEIEGYEDLAYVRGTSTITIRTPGEEPLSIRGKYLDIRRRVADGTWKVSVDMFSPDSPVELCHKETSV